VIVSINRPFEEISFLKRKADEAGKDLKGEVGFCPHSFTLLFQEA
jgi:hypothetical protein